MSKRTSPEQHVIAYFMSQPYALAEQMASTVKAIMRQRGEEPANPPKAAKAPARKRPAAKPRAALGQPPVLYTHPQDEEKVS